MPSMQDFWKLLRGLLTLARQSINEQLVQLELTSADGDVIYHLAINASGLSQEDLCERIGINKAAVSRTVDSLVQKGFAKRDKNPQDARANIVHMTQNGVAISDSVLSAYNYVFHVIQRGIPEGDFRIVFSLLARIQNSLASHGAIYD